MPKRAKGKNIKQANKRISRPEDPATQRRRRSARLLRMDMLPEASGAMLHAEEEQPQDSETEAALRRATDPAKQETGEGR